MVEQEQKKQISPSEFMRQLRSEYYSNTTTITSRNQRHDFEIFCRKLCERTIFLNLKLWYRLSQHRHSDISKI